MMLFAYACLGSELSRYWTQAPKLPSTAQRCLRIFTIRRGLIVQLHRSRHDEFAGAFRAWANIVIWQVAWIDMQITLDLLSFRAGCSRKSGIRIIRYLKIFRNLSDHVLCLTAWILTGVATQTSFTMLQFLGTGAGQRTTWIHLTNSLTWHGYNFFNSPSQANHSKCDVADGSTKPSIQRSTT